MLNDPYAGGTHLPDITMVRPVFVAGRRQPSFYVVDRAHHADVGGAFAGSMAAAPSVSRGLASPDFSPAPGIPAALALLERV